MDEPVTFEEARYILADLNLFHDRLYLFVAQCEAERKRARELIERWLNIPPGAAPSNDTYAFLEETKP